MAELTEFCGKLGGFCEIRRNSVSLLWHRGWEELTEFSPWNWARAKKNSLSETVLSETVLGQSLRLLGACAMTTKFLDNNICTFKILLSWHFPRKKKTAFWTIFLSAPKAPSPQKTNILFLLSSRCLWTLTFAKCGPTPYSASLWRLPNSMHTKGSCNNMLLRRFSNSKCFLEGFFEGTCEVFSKDQVLRREHFIEGA